MDFDSTGLYSCAVWDEKSIYPKLDSGFAGKPRMKDIYIEALNKQAFNQIGNESAILKKKFYNPQNFIFHHLLVKENIGKIDVDRLINGHSIGV